MQVHIGLPQLPAFGFLAEQGNQHFKLSIRVLIQKEEDHLVDSIATYGSNLSHSLSNLSWGEELLENGSRQYLNELRGIWGADAALSWLERLAFNIGFMLERQRGISNVDRDTCHYKNIEYFVNNVKASSIGHVGALLEIPDLTHKLGFFALEHDTLIATDPCYQHPSSGHCFKAKSGLWSASCLSGPTQWNRRVKELRIVHQSLLANSDCVQKRIAEIFSAVHTFEQVSFLGIDSAQCGFFDYSSYEKQKSLGDDSLFEACADSVCSEVGFKSAVIKGIGAVASSGFGDCGATLFVLKDKDEVAVASVLRFIGETAQPAFNCDNSKQFQS